MLQTTRRTRQILNRISNRKITILGQATRKEQRKKAISQIERVQEYRSQIKTALRQRRKNN